MERKKGSLSPENYWRNYENEIDPSKNGLEVELIEEYRFHDSNVNSVLYFEKSTILVSCSCDCILNIFDLISRKRSIIECNRRFRDMCKWNDDVFLSCDIDGAVFSWSISSKKILKKVFSRNDREFGSIERLNSEVFALIDSYEDEIFIVDYEGQIISNFLFPVYHLSRILVSKTNDRERFCPSDNSIDLVDYQTGKLEKRYNKHKFFCMYSIQSYVDYSDDEILLVGGSNRKVYFYSKHSGEMFRSVKNIDAFVRSLYVLNSRFVVIGTANSARDEGELHIYDVTSPRTKKLYQERIHECSVTNIEFFQSPVTNELELITTGENDLIKHFSVRNLGFFFDKELLQRDRIERVEYLRSNGLTTDLDILRIGIQEKVLNVVKVLLFF